MKLYKCKIRITTVRESFELVVAPNKAAARDSEWVRFADIEHHIEGTIDTKNNYEVTHVQGISSLDQVPEDRRDTLPWYHPKYGTPDEHSIKEMFQEKEVDTSDLEYKVGVEIRLREEDIASIKKDIAALKAMLPKKNG